MYCTHIYFDWRGYMQNEKKTSWFQFDTWTSFKWFLRFPAEEREKKISAMVSESRKRRFKRTSALS